LIHDPEKVGKCFSPVAGKITDKGTKIVIHPLSIEWLLLDMPDAPVDTSEVSDSRRKNYKQWVEEWRREAREIIDNIDHEQDKKNGETEAPEERKD